MLWSSGTLREAGTDVVELVPAVTRRAALLLNPYLLRAAARERGEIRDRMARLEVSLGERMARLEGTLDVLREYFVGQGRGAA